MLIASQNISNYRLGLPDDCVLRINLAWCDSLDQLQSTLEKQNDKKIFLDLPIGRIKPPNNRYSLKDIIPILKKYNNIKFFAISNVETKENLTEFIDLIPKNIILVPKIESPSGIFNIKSIVEAIPSDEKIIMLDHDDLFSSIIKKGQNTDKFQDYIKELIDFCDNNKVSLLRTVGVIFSDDEKRLTQYVK